MFVARNFLLNPGEANSFDVTDATRCHIAFVSSSPIFWEVRSKILGRLQPLPFTA